MPPTAIITQPIANIPFGSLPANVGLSGTSSTPGTGSIVTWEWTIRWPTDGSATLTGGSTSTPTLTITTPTTVVLDLNIKNDSNEWAWDHVDTDAWLTVPVVMPTARVYVVATTEFAALEIPGLAERHSTNVGATNNLMGKWNGLFAEVDDLRGDIDTFIAGAEFENLYVDNIYELTPTHMIVLKDDVTSEGTITIDSAEALVANAIGPPIDTNLTISRPATLASNLSSVTLSNGVVTVAGGAGAQLDLYATYYSPRSNNAGIIVRGRGTHAADMFIDVIGEDTAAAGVTIDSVLIKDGAVTVTPSGGSPAGYVSTDEVRERTLGNGVRVDQIRVLDTALQDVNSVTAPVGQTLEIIGNDDLNMGASADILLASTSASVTARGGVGQTDFKADIIAGDSGNQVTLQYAVFTGTSAANSQLAISAVVADDSGAVGIGLDGVGASLLLQATTVTVQASGTLKTDNIIETTAAAGVTIEGVLIKDSTVDGVTMSTLPTTVTCETLNAYPSGTSIETVDTFTVPTLAANQKMDFVYLVEQTVANACILEVIVDGVTYLSDSRSQVADRMVWLSFVRRDSNNIMPSFQYRYGSSSPVFYCPTEADIAKTAAQTFDISIRIHNATAASDMGLIHRQGIRTPALT